MFRNQYDTDVVTFSPQGRLHQVEYATEAVKQGSACLGLRSSTHAVLAALKRSPHTLAAYQKKLVPVDSHMGVAVAGLTADARSLVRWMRTECLNHRHVYSTAPPVGRLVTDLSDAAQWATQAYVRRPYGVGLLVAAYDDQGPHIVQTTPAGECYEYYAMSIGARAQSAKTYLEKHYEDFPDCGEDDLIKHAIKALAGTVQGDQELDVDNTSIAIVGEGRPFEIIEGERLQEYMNQVEIEADNAGGEGAGEGQAVMEETS